MGSFNLFALFSFYFAFKIPSLRMRLLLQCVLLLSLFTFKAAGLDFKLESRASGQLSFVKQTDSGARLVKRSLQAWLPAASRLHKIRRRSAGGEQVDTCQALKGYEPKLAANTHRVSYPLPLSVLLHFTRLTIKRAGRTSCTGVREPGAKK